MAKRLSPEEKAKREAEKKRKAAEKEAEKKRKAAEKEAEKKRKAAEKERKVAEKEANTMKVGSLDTNKNLNSFNILGFVSCIRLFNSKISSASIKESGTSAGILLQRLINTNNENEPAYSATGKLSSPSALTLCLKSGLCDNSVRFTSLGKAVASASIQIEEYALVLLSKQWVTLGKDVKCHVVELLHKLFRANKQLPYSNSAFTNTVINALKAEYDFENDGFRLEFLRELLITSKLIKVCAKNKEKTTIVEDAEEDAEDRKVETDALYLEIDPQKSLVWEEMAKKLKNLDYPNKLNVSEDSFYEYLGDIRKGITEIIDDSNKEIFKDYPHLIFLDKHYMHKADYTKFLSELKQSIKYGAPGTGKSFGTQDNERVDRVTFHPDSDYSSFVGCYKPRTRDGKIAYAFVPQAFLEAYVKAWCDPQNQYTLIIEEINRGNCATIFGDIFQLLDRDEDGFSRYPITCDTDMWESYLKSHLPVNYVEDGLEAHYKNEQHAGTDFCGEGKMALPPNLSICATMNTSDQSLYKMDSAFKRRWKMEYVPIKYKAKLKEDGTPIEGEEGLYRLEKVHLDFYDKLPWLEILYSINAFIRNRLDSTSKQMGQWFIVPEKEGEDFVDIPFEVFRDKLVFYLFNDVFKKSDILNQPFGKEEDGSLFLFEDLCTEKDGGKALCETFLDNVTKDFPYPKD